VLQTLKQQANAEPPLKAPKPSEAFPVSEEQPPKAPAANDTDTYTITELEVFKAQADWGNAIKRISEVYLAGGDFVGAAGSAAGELYGYGHSKVLFKPTKAAEFPFRPTAGEAMSYFVGGKVVDGGYTEDAGFAINGGKGWSNVVFDNHQVDLNGNTAIAMGTYHFTSAADGSETKVEYTFGYKKNEDGKVRIFLHHSSVPYSTAAAGPAPVTEEEVLMVQASRSPLAPSPPLSPPRCSRAAFAS
jgi:hypothetical protein